MSVEKVVCCQVEVSASGWSLVQRSPTDCGVSKVCDREASKGGLGPLRLSSHGQKTVICLMSMLTS
jgi:hypothetical protein